MNKQFNWIEDAEKAIRQHFNDRNAARGRQGKRVAIRKRFVDLKENGDMVYSYAYASEAVILTKQAYGYEVNFL